MYTIKILGSWVETSWVWVVEMTGQDNINEKTRQKWFANFFFRSSFFWLNWDGSCCLIFHQKISIQQTMQKERCQRQCRVDDKVYNKIVWKRIYGFAWHNKICPLHFFFLFSRSIFIYWELPFILDFFFSFFLIGICKVCNLTRQQSICTHAFTRAHTHAMPSQQLFNFHLLKC